MNFILTALSSICISNKLLINYINWCGDTNSFSQRFRNNIRKLIYNVLIYYLIKDRMREYEI